MEQIFDPGKRMMRTSELAPRIEGLTSATVKIYTKMRFLYYLCTRRKYNVLSTWRKVPELGSSVRKAGAPSRRKDGFLIRKYFNKNEIPLKYLNY